MKRIYITALILMMSLPGFAQFKLSGKVLNQTTPDTLYVNIPYVFGHNYLSEIPIITDAKGNFNTNIDVKEQKFARLTYRGIKTALLLAPGGTLKLTIDSGKNLIAMFEGSAAAKNRLLYHLQLEKAAFFWGDDHSDAPNPYSKLTAAEVQERIFKPLLAERDRQLELVSASNLSARDKELIAQEVRAKAINDMSDYIRTVWRTFNKQEYGEMMRQIFQNGEPKAEITPAGPKFYASADQYIGYLESETFIEHKALPADKRDKTPLKYYGLTVDSGKKVAAAKGKAYMNWLAAKNGMTRANAEALLAQYIFDKTDDKMLSEAVGLVTELKANYADSKYLPFLHERVKLLQYALAANAKNADIRIIDGYEKITSIYQVINQLKGKVVYLDVWGTWCGPCKEELKYNPLLKEHFKGKHVAFVYLDMDDDVKDAQWREFIRVNKITGIHLRKNREAIQPFWDELITDKTKQRGYPTYFIFDKTGKLVEADANRPSFKELTYKQLEKYL